MSDTKRNDPRQSEDKESKGREKSTSSQSSSLHQDPTRPVKPADEADESIPESEFDEGPRPGPVDEIQEALFEAAKANLPTEVEFDKLSGPTADLEDLDEGPRPGPVDEVQEAIFSAVQEGAVEVDFDNLPEPTPPVTHKVIKFDNKKKAPSEAEPEQVQAPPPPADVAPQVEPEVQPPAEPTPADDIEIEIEPDPIPTIPDFWFLLALFVTFRLLTLFLLKPGGFIRDWSDFDTYFGIVSLTDYSLYPFLNFWLEWPPLVPWLAVGAYKLSLLLPPWPDDPRLWFIMILGGVFVLFEIGNFVLIYRLARRLFQTPETISRTLWIYAGLFPPIYTMLGFFDGVALFFILLALDFILADRRFLSAVAVGIGFMVKIIPVLMLAVAARRLWHKYRADNRAAGIEIGLYAVIAGITIIILLVPFIILPALNGQPQWWITAFRSMLGRSSWETIWAVAEGYYGFGAVEGDRWNAAETAFAVHHGWGTGAWALITLAWAGIYGFVFSRQANYNRARNLVAFAGLTVAIFMLYSKGYSPQFLVYLLPFILLLMPNGRGLTYMLALTGLNILEQPVYFVLTPNASWLLIFVVVTRFIITAMLALEFALVLWPSEVRLATFAQVSRRVPVALGVFAAVALLIVTPLTIRAYNLERVQNSPIGTFAGFMRSQLDEDQPDAGKPRLLLSEQAAYRQIYPQLHNDYDLQLTDGPSRELPTTTLPELLQGLNRVWLLPTGPQANPLTNAVASRGTEIGAYYFDGLGSASLYTLRPNPVRRIAPARFVGGIELLSHQIETSSNSVNVTLYWRARNPQNQDLTVFTHLLNVDGQRVAGHDSIPANGTAPVKGWVQDAVVADSHRIELPPNLPPGEYSLIAGLYNSFSDRVQSTDPAGVSYANRAVPLATVQLE